MLRTCNCCWPKWLISCCIQWYLTNERLSTHLYCLSIAAQGAFTFMPSCWCRDVVSKCQNVGKAGFSTTRYATVKINQFAVRGPGEEIPTLAITCSGQTVVFPRRAEVRDNVMDRFLFCFASCHRPSVHLCNSFTFIVARFCGQGIK